MCEEGLCGHCHVADLLSLIWHAWRVEAAQQTQLGNIVVTFIHPHSFSKYSVMVVVGNVQQRVSVGNLLVTLCFCWLLGDLHFFWLGFYISLSG